MNLADAQVGHAYIITSIDVDAPSAQRLMSFGLLPDVKLTVTGVAPFGDPLTLETDTGTLSLRREDARAIEVEEVS